MGICSSTQNEGIIECAICYEPVIKKEQVVSDKCKCKLIYHTKCLNMCKTKNHMECASCRLPVDTKIINVPEITCSNCSNNCNDQYVIVNCFHYTCYLCKECNILESFKCNICVDPLSVTFHEDN
jgi:hypothetical protein